MPHMIHIFQTETHTIIINVIVNFAAIDGLKKVIALRPIPFDACVLLEDKDGNRLRQLHISRTAAASFIY